MKILDVVDLSIRIKKGNTFSDKIINQSFSINSGDVILLSGPNGSGKSSIIKSLVGDTLDFSDLDAKGQFIYYDGDKQIIVNRNDSSRSYFAGKVCYVAQSDDSAFDEVLDCCLFGIDKEDIENKEKYVFDFMIEHSIYKCYFSDEDEIKNNSKSLKLLRRIGIDNPTTEQIATALFLKSKRKNMSGGQAKFLNIVSNLLRHKFCDLCLMDEPLNNLDYSNVRLFANMLTSIHEQTPGLAFLVVTHCRSIPIINRIIQIDTNSKALVEISNIKDAFSPECNSCFGEVHNGRYI